MPEKIIADLLYKTLSSTTKPELGRGKWPWEDPAVLPQWAYPACQLLVSSSARRLSSSGVVTLEIQIVDLRV